MRRARAVTSGVFLSLVSFGFCWADPHVYFSSQDDVQHQVIAAIDASRSSVDAALFEVTSPALAHALVHASERGVTVRLLTSSKNPPDLLKKEWLPNLEIRTLGGRSRRGGVMHNKFAVFDHGAIVTGSFNWTRGAQYANYENALFEDDDAIVRAYSRQFDDLWNKASWTEPQAVRKKGSRKHRYD